MTLAVVLMLRITEASLSPGGEVLLAVLLAHPRQHERLVVHGESEDTANMNMGIDGTMSSRSGSRITAFDELVATAG